MFSKNSLVRTMTLTLFLGISTIHVYSQEIVHKSIISQNHSAKVTHQAWFDVGYLDSPLQSFVESTENDLRGEAYVSLNYQANQNRWEIFSSINQFGAIEGLIKDSQQSINSLNYLYQIHYINHFRSYLGTGITSRKLSLRRNCKPTSDSLIKLTEYQCETRHLNQIVLPFHLHFLYGKYAGMSLNNSFNLSLDGWDYRVSLGLALGYLL